jgi:hypothetical protein
MKATEWTLSHNRDVSEAEAPKRQIVTYQKGRHFKAEVREEGRVLFLTMAYDTAGEAEAVARTRLPILASPKPRG